MCIALDPFGCYLGDGVPVVWIFKVITKERLLAEKRPSKWTHWIDEDEWSTVPVGDVASAQTFSDGDNLYLARRVEVVGRAVSDVKNELTPFLKT
jgi:hypothetical protein